MKTFAYALAVIASIGALSPAFAAPKAKHMSKTTMSRDSGDAAVAKLNQDQLDKIKSGQ